MDAEREPEEVVETGPHFNAEAGEAAWEEIEPGRFMPRRVRGSFRGRALG